MRTLTISALAISATLCGTSYAMDTTDWSCSSAAACGASTANGVVTAAPIAGTTGYGWVTTANSNQFDHTKLPLNLPNTGVTNGATYTSPAFAVSTSNTVLDFYFNYVTSDGISDYAWARLVDASGAEVALLFTARTDSTSTIVPGSGMPLPSATLTPANVPISSGTTWQPLGGASGSCFGLGCGHTGWVRAQYSIATPGNYKLEVGVVNWSDMLYDSGLAVDGLIVGGVAPTPVPVPVPVPTLSKWMLVMLAGLLATFAMTRFGTRCSER